ncbi:MAG: hypothetical protein R3Y53_07030 [Bacillota bacterium]
MKQNCEEVSKREEELWKKCGAVRRICEEVGKRCCKEECGVMGKSCGEVGKRAEKL